MRLADAVLRCTTENFHFNRQNIAFYCTCMFSQCIPDRAVIEKMMADKSQEVLQIEKKYMDMLKEKHAGVRYFFKTF